MHSAQERIRLTVENYIKLFPDEYAAFQHGMNTVRATLKDEEFGQANTERNSSSDTRALYELPETLFSMFVQALSEEEIAWFKTKPGGRWFAKTFPVFRIPASV